MKKWLMRALRTALLLPAIPIIGIPSGADDDVEPDKTPPTGGEEPVKEPPVDDDPPNDGDKKEPPPAADGEEGGKPDLPADGDEGKEPSDKDAADPKIAQLQHDLAMSNAMVEAFRCGISPDAVEDAVALAVYALQRDGKPIDKAAVAEELKGVLTRHPEWQAGVRPKPTMRGGAPSPDTPVKSKEEAYLDKKYAGNPYYKKED